MPRQGLGSSVTASGGDRRLVGLDHVLRLGTAGREGTLHLHLGGRGRLGRGRRGSLARAADRSAVGLVAPDQALALTSAGGGRVGQVDLADVGRGGGTRAASSDGSPIEMIAVPTGTVSPSGTSSAGHHAGVRRGQLDQRLGGLDLDDDVVDLDGVALLDPPGHDLGLGQALADVGEQVVSHALLLRTPAIGRRHRAAGRGRAGSPPRSGTAGYGVSNPPTRSTGASSE